MSRPRSLSPPGNGAIHVTGLALATFVFAIELRLPEGSAVEILYVFPILLGLWTSWQAYPAVAALACAALTLFGTATREGNLIAHVFIAAALLLTGLFVARFKRLQQKDQHLTEQLADVTHALDRAAIVATTDVKGRITYVNDKFCEISGYSRDELLGQDHRVVNSGFHPPEFIRDLWVTIARGLVWHGEIQNRSKTGEPYWVDTTIVPFLDDGRKPYQYIAIRSDITRRKLAEQKLVQQEALARVGQLAAVVAHEVRNPLAGIKGAMQVLITRRPADDPDLQVLRDVVTRIDALSELINDLMVYARPRALQLTTVDLQALVGEAVSVARRDPNCQGLNITVGGEAVSTRGDSELLRAALLNLLLNAGQAMGGKGRVDLNVTLQDGTVVVEIRDAGPGMTAEIRGKVFEPFFSTKARGGGLGLPIARRTAELHGGTLALRCPPEGGTVVTLSLPLRTGEA